MGGTGDRGTGPLSQKKWTVLIEDTLETLFYILLTILKTRTGHYRRCNQAADPSKFYQRNVV
jgi:hypothetical protein